MPQRANPLNVLIEFCAVVEAIAILFFFFLVGRFPKLIHGPNKCENIRLFMFNWETNSTKLKSLNKEIHLLENNGWPVAAIWGIHNLYKYINGSAKGISLKPKKTMKPKTKNHSVQCFWSLSFGSLSHQRHFVLPMYLVCCELIWFLFASFSFDDK